MCGEHCRWPKWQWYAHAYLPQETYVWRKLFTWLLNGRPSREQRFTDLVCVLLMCQVVLQMASDLTMAKMCKQLTDMRSELDRIKNPPNKQKYSGQYEPTQHTQQKSFNHHNRDPNKWACWGCGEHGHFQTDALNRTPITHNYTQPGKLDLAVLQGQSLARTDTNYSTTHVLITCNTYRVFQKKQYRNVIKTNVAKVYWFCMCAHVIKIITL